MKSGSRLSCCAALLLLLPLITTSQAAAQAPPPPTPLSFGNNFFVTGDYIVAGAYNMTSSFQTINGVSYAVGTIRVPDANSKGTLNPGIQGPRQVPPGAQIVTALLYWQTVEKVGVMPGQPGSGENAFFRPVVTGGVAAPGYAIQATNVTGANTVSWSSGGCNSGSTGKLLRTYRADVGGALPLDGSGNPTANGTFEVRIPSSGNATPLTLGATLVVIYRVPGGVGVPLNAIVIYDGDYSQSNSALTMTQSMQGFYDAAKNPVSKITHIVGGGQSNKFQTVFLASGKNKSIALPLLYGKNSPTFPGNYGTWDNPTWQFTNADGVKNPGVVEDDSFITTQVVPALSMQGCVSWGAIIVSTTAKNTDGDGILDSWKNDARGPGYCDASINNGSCTGAGDPNGAWVDLTGAMSGQKDIFLQYDYLCSSITNGVCATGGPNYSFDPRLAVDPADSANAIDKVVTAFDNHLPFKLHAIPGNAILENDPNNPLNLSCTDSAQAGPTCPFPIELGVNGLGTIGFRDGLTYIKNESVNPNTGSLCAPGTAGCVPVFQHGKKDSYHYAFFSHGVGLPSWFLSDGSLKSVSQTGSTVTFTTLTPHGIAPIPGDFCQLGRVSVVYAISNTSLEGTYCVLANPAPTATTFAIKVGGTPTKSAVSYTKLTDPNLSVADGRVSSMSGFSDVGGQDSVVSLGYGNWGPPTNPASDGRKWQVKAGTFMHELGHTLGLTHGGTFYGNLANEDYTPLFEANCKPNSQSVMNYQFQVDLLEVPNTLDALGNPLMVVDYSKDALNTLVEMQPQGVGSLSGASYANTAWFQLTSFAGGTKTSPHCDGSSSSNDPNSYAYVTDNVNNFFWSNATGLDINFNGASNDTMHGHDEWEGNVQAGVSPSPGLDLQQVSSIGTITTVGLGGEAGALKPAGGGGALKPAGGGGALKPAGGGGALKPAGGGGLKTDITHEQANSYARPPRGLTIVSEDASPRLIHLSWFIPTFGTTVQYNIYQSVAGGPFMLHASVPGSQTTFQEKVTCNLNGYSYRVTSVVNNDSPPPTTLESVPSNTVPVTTGNSPEHLLTGCYTSPVTVAVQASGVQGDIVPVTWTLTDDFFITSPPPAPWSEATAGNPVTNKGANTLVITGPSPASCGRSGPSTILLNGNPQTGNSTFPDPNPSTGQFTFNWDTDNYCAGSYTIELDLDSGQKFTSSALQLSIDINNQDTMRVTTLALPNGTVGLAYSDTLTEEGGKSPFTWTISGLPTGIAQQPAGSATISGTTCVAAGTYSVNATVLDSANPQNSGTQALSLLINKANTTTSVSADSDPSVFQQPVTFTVTVAPQYSCTPTGTVTLSVDGTAVGSKVLVSGAATFSMSNLSVSSPGSHSITASYGGDNSFNGSNNNSTPWPQTVNKASTSLSLVSVSPTPVFTNQPVTVSWTFGVVSPGQGSPIAPTGNIMVAASDGSGCTATPTLGGGMCTLSPAPTATGNVTFTITYPGDGNFVTSGANSSYNVYQLAFTTQPATTGVGLTMPSVVVTAQDFNNSNQPLTSFTGGVTLAIGSGPGTLAGSPTQNAVAGVATFSDLSINKIATGDTLTAAPAGGLVSATSNAFNIDTFYIDSSGNFGTLDLATGTATQIGSATVPNSTGIDLTPTLAVYTYSTANQLTQITPSSGAGAAVGSPGNIPDVPTTGALTTGSYFGIDALNGNLYSIALGTGATTLLGNTAVGVALPAGCTYETSLTGSATVLYYTIGYSGASCSPLEDTFYQIDPGSGTVKGTAAITVGGSGVNGFVGSAFVGGTLYGFTSDGKEYSIDPATGVATLKTAITPTTAIIGAGGQ